ncbi:methyl-accepting chemotaxis protein [Massilia sp. SM-13]|uniref:methyl-accepting chemotaxis protein n=1 Tax=Pseudoduganella rhizocola TaxID=3382643 RepID=UPI0038B48DC2
MRLQNLRIGQRLALSFGAVIVAMTALGAMRTAGMVETIRFLKDDSYQQTVQAHIAKDELNRIARSMRNALLMDDAKEALEEIDKIADSSRKISAALDRLAADNTDGESGRLFREVLAARESFVAERGRFLDLLKAGNKDQARLHLLGTLRPIQLAYMATLDKFVERQSLEMKEAGDAAEVQALETRYELMAMAAVAAALASVLAYFATRSVSRPLQSAVKFADQVANGDLSCTIEVRGNDETGQLLRALQTMNARLSDAIRQIRQGADTMSTVAGEIASGNMDLSSRTEQQASALEETASSMEELTSTVAQNNENAQQANQLAVQASEVARDGGVVVAEVVQTMDAINDASRKIVDIISVIDGIAFQTNILALNAAVEAARAGEQGRGFAVVASEVRNLAQRSATAAKEIKHLIDDTVGKVGEGSRLVGQAGVTMNNVVDSVQRVTDIMSEIMAASQEQRAGIEQINQAVSDMDSVTQQNAALVEEAAAASASMQEQAAQLVQAVAIFRLGSQAAQGPAAPASRVAGRLQRPAVHHMPLPAAA